MGLESYYKTPTDIAFYFRDKDSIKELLEYIFKEAALFCDAIDKNGNQIPYPVILCNKSNLFQIDYQFMVHTIAKYIATKTGDNSKYKSVIWHFSIHSRSVGKGTVIYEKNRFFLAYLMECLGVIALLGNIGSYKNSEKLLWKTNNLYAKKVLEYNGNYFEFMAVSFSNSDKTGVQYFGPSKYLEVKWDTIKERFRVKNSPIQASFGADIPKFYDKNNIKKRFYFMINVENITDFIDYELISQIEKL